MPDNQAKYRRHGARYKARRRAVDVIYEAEVRDLDPVSIVEDRERLSRNPNSQVAPVSPYTRVLVTGTAERLDELDDLIARYLSEDWELHRLPAVDRAILRVMAWEILYVDDVDAPISVVEAVEIATEYSTDVAAPYIHAVLDDIVQSRSADNPMNVIPDEDDSEEDHGAEGAAGEHLLGKDPLIEVASEDQTVDDARDASGTTGSAEVDASTRPVPEQPSSEN